MYNPIVNIHVAVQNGFHLLHVALYNLVIHRGPISGAKIGKMVFLFINPA